MAKEPRGGVEEGTRTSVRSKKVVCNKTFYERKAVSGTVGATGGDVRIL